MGVQTVAGPPITSPAEANPPDTGEPSVDEALSLVSDLGSKTPVEATEALSHVLQKLERILAQSQNAGSK